MTGNEVKRVAWRLSALLLALWGLVALLSWAFVYFFLPLSPERVVEFSLAWFVACVGAAAGVCWLVHWWLRQGGPSLGPVRSGSADQSGQAPVEVPEAAGKLHLRVGALGFLPVLILPLVGLAGGLPLGPLVALGLCDSLLLAFAGMLLAQSALQPLLQRLAEAQGGWWSGRLVSLRFKLAVLSFALAVFPALLVGVSSFEISYRQLGREMGNYLSEKLSHLARDVASLVSSGLGRDELAAYLTDEADKLTTASYLHIGQPGGDFYQSRGALPLEPDIYQSILKRSEQTPKGIVEGSGGGIFAYATMSAEGWLAIAPVDQKVLEPAVRRLKVLILIITVFAMALALVVGNVFAGQQGALIRRMAAVTGQVAQGQLDQDFNLVSDDEVGLLGTSLGTMVRNLRATVENVTGLASQVAGTCNQLLLKASAISTGAGLQSQTVQETSSSVEEMNANIQSASESLQSLAQYSQETAEAVQKLGENFNLMTAETNSLHRTVEDTGGVVQTMVAAVVEVADSIAKLSEAAERTVASVAEMDRSISDISRSAADTTTLSRKAIEVAQQGAVSVRRTVEGMERIVNSSRETTGVILGLGNRIEAISGILGVIDEIADQTNLLALNAAIIAAQAGEHGRAFAVVADEIRSLAERTGSSTREIGQMIRDIQDTSETAIKTMREGGGIVNEGMALAKQAGEALTEILLSFQKTVENVESIATNTERHSRTSELAARDTARVADMSGHIASLAQQLHKSGQKLQEAFTQTQRSTAQLAGMVGQQAQENRAAIVAVAEINEATTRVNSALLEQSKTSDGILAAIEQVREIAKNHAAAAQEMGEATEKLAETAARLKDEVGEFQL